MNKMETKKKIDKSEETKKDERYEELYSELKEEEGKYETLLDRFSAIEKKVTKKDI
jgi:hypothetical protein